jgi:hypothetical protein
VLVDGKPRGATPLALNDLVPGRHEVTLKSDAGTVRRIVKIVVGEPAVIEEAIFSGWVTVLAPFDLTIAENGRVLRPDERNQVMLPPGSHELRLTNAALGYEAVRQVEVKPGEGANVRLAPDASQLTVTANEAAEVWLDGTRIGETPLNGIPVQLGTHELQVKRAAGGERRLTVTVGVNPFSVNVAF